MHLREKPTRRQLPVRQPPDQGPLLKQQRALTQSELAAFATLETEMGGRARLVATLAGANLNGKLYAVLGMIADPQHDRESLGEICAAGGVQLSELMSVFQAAAKTRGQMLAISRIADRAPDVAVGVMEAAIPGVKECPRCLGARVLDAPVNEQNPDGKQACPNCNGAGTIYHLPNHDVQKTALKISGLLDGGKGSVNLQVLNQQFNGNTDVGYDQLIEGLDTLLYGKGRERLSPPPPAGDEGEIVEGETA